MADWNEMFISRLPLLEIVLRPALIYLFFIFAMRLSGKRELAEMNPADLIVLLIISEAAQNGLVSDDKSITTSVLCISTLLFLNYAVNRLSYKSRKLEKLLEGESEVIFEHGRINQKVLQRESLTREELESGARLQGFAGLHEVERATLEAGGDVSYKGKEPEKHRQRELLKRLDALAEQVTRIEAQLRRAD